MKIRKTVDKISIIAPGALALTIAIILIEDALTGIKHKVRGVHNAPLEMPAEKMPVPDKPDFTALDGKQKKSAFF